MTKPIVVVTGGAGFIGSHVVDRFLEQGHEVRVIDNFSTGRPENLVHHAQNPRLKLLNADITDKGACAEVINGAQWVIHIAALADVVPSIERPLEYHASNVSGTIAVLEAARAAGVSRFAYAASSSCYGIPDEYPTAETAEIRPQYPYALTKNLGEQYVMAWNKTYGIPTVSLRFFNVYGPRSRTSGTYGAMFGVFLAQRLAGKPFTVVGDGTQSRDFTYVSDIVSGIETAIKSDVSGEIMNIGSGKTVSVNRIVELLGGKAVYIPKRPGEPDCTFADIGKINRLLGWKPTIPIETGILRLLENIDYWKDAPVWTPESIEKATASWFKYLK